MSVTHAIYAKKIAEHIKLKYGITLRKYNLIYGSTKPDISVFFAKHPHYIDKSLIPICKNARLLINSTDGKNQLETRAFSRELGGILHYMTDFFCKVHNDVGGKKHPTNYKHIVYEQRFQNKLKKYELDEIREKVSNFLDRDINTIENESLEKYISKMHDKYMRCLSKCKLSGSRKMDMEYSYGMSLIVASYVVNEILNKEGKK